MLQIEGLGDGQAVRDRSCNKIIPTVLIARQSVLLYCKLVVAAIMACGSNSYCLFSYARQFTVLECISLLRVVNITCILKFISCASVLVAHINYV